MFFSIFPDKDNTITNLRIRGRSMSGSNSGQSEILELYVLTSSADRVGKSRILINFDLTDLITSISQNETPSSSVEYRLRLKNADHFSQIPYSYDLKVFPLSQSWDEGRGLSMEDEDLKDKGVSNWANATNQSPWTDLGADFYTEPSASQYFSFGTEHIDIDISNIVYAWLTGGLENNGLVIKYSDFFDTGSNDLYVKKFYSRHSLVPERKPSITALWNDVIEDDRVNFRYNNSGSLYFYRFFGGLPENVSGDVFVDILSSSTVLQTITASAAANGIYHASGVFVNPSDSVSTFRDVWFTDSEQLFTGSLTPVYGTGSHKLDFDSLNIGITNIKQKYGTDENVTLRVFAREKDYKPAVVQVATSRFSPILLKEAYYQIENAETKDVLVSFSTGSNKYSKLSYDYDGNYFKIKTNSLPKDSVYKLKILVIYNGKKIVFDKNWLFTIRE